jgi:hypothetical protein
MYSTRPTFSGGERSNGWIIFCSVGEETPQEAKLKEMAAACSSSSSSAGEEVPLREKNYHLMEGPWGDFVFKRVKLSDWPRVIQHIQQHFMRDEPTCQLLGYTNDFGDEMEAIVRQMLGDNLSFLVEHKATEEVIKDF